MRVRKLDNTAKIFSLDSKKNNNLYRMTVTLTEPVDPRLLKKSVILALDYYPSYKVRKSLGFFWNAFSKNERNPIVEQKTIHPGKKIWFHRSNDYLFKVTFFENQINLDVIHVLTDGGGAFIFLKAILYFYLSEKYQLKNPILKQIPKLSSEDPYQSIVDLEKKTAPSSSKSYLIKKETAFLHNFKTKYQMKIADLKKVCKKKKVSITEYLTALYIFSIYQTIYDKKKNRDIKITIPIDLRKYYPEEVFTNFFTCMVIEGKILECEKVTFNNLLKEVKKQFEERLTKEQIDAYVARDVRLGNNLAISFVPLGIKKLFMRFLGTYVSQSTTSTLSNLGQITLEEPFSSYVEDIHTSVNPGRTQKVKCTITSYQDNLTIVLNSNLACHQMEQEFYRLLKKQIKNLSFESDILKNQ